ncbi:alternative ribosome rescue aminoacyl-tRNA hydrolase ArfB [Planctomicrobium sp. SH664]|uniref:alternative ribosome rescue aminoacyl-tRNA hydrolase ArfB n=1 Tax=Planctomicrobium sp. SH664 TaxID=3448125 RepID=UPI003F5BCF18
MKTPGECTLTTHLEINEQLSVPLEELSFAYVRSSGPGGQNVNKVNSQVQLSWNVSTTTALPADVHERLKSAEKGRISKAGILRIDCQTSRDREKNRAECLDRLKTMIMAVAKPPKKRRKTRATKASRERRLQSKQQRGDLKRSRRSPRQDD